MNKSIKANQKAIGIPELRHLYDMQNFNKMLMHDEFLEIVRVYQKAIDRVTKEAKHQGVDIYK